MPETAAPVPGYLATPPVGSGPWPGVIVLHEAFGLTDDIRLHADRLAAAGYLALAPDLFARGGALRCLRPSFRAVLTGHGQAFDDVEAARRSLVARDDCTGRVGVVGFCLGGGFALLAASRGFDASSVSYGYVPRDLDAVLDGACPVVASYGSRDPAGRGAVPRLEEAMTRLGVEHDVKEYPGVGHSFMNRHNTGPFRVLEKVVGLGYDHAASEDAWRRILGFFDEHLGAQRAE